MYKNETFLTPLPCVPPPPKNSEIQIRCFTCKHFGICKILPDYLKTATLIQNVLGYPADPLELVKIKGFIGTVVENPDSYFPKEIIANKDKKGEFFGAKYESETIVNFIYKFDCYFVLYKATYNSETKEFDIPAGKEVYYGVDFTIEKESLDDLQLGLLTLKENIENKECPCSKDKDVINVSAFSAALNCDFYEWEKGLTYEEGMRRIVMKYPDGIPIDKCGTLYHLATYHIEPSKVPCYHPENGKVAFMPMPYPVYIPEKPCGCQRNKTRCELNEDF